MCREDSPLAKTQRSMKDCDHIRHPVEPLKSQMVVVLFFTILVLQKTKWQQTAPTQNLDPHQGKRLPSAKAGAFPRLLPWFGFLLNLKHHEQKQPDEEFISSYSSWVMPHH